MSLALDKTRRLRIVGLALFLALSSGLAQSRLALAHVGVPPAPHDLWQAWNWDPWLLFGLTLTAYLYGRGVYALWQRAGVGRGVTGRQLWFFGLGLFSLVVALISPLDALSEALFSAHMVQHMVLLYLAPLLLVLGAPPVLWVWALPRAWRRPVSRWWQTSLWHRLWSYLLHPLTIWSLFGVVLWVWHAPALYQAAVLNRTIHILEHVSFFGASLLFCWLLVYGRGQTTAKRAASDGAILLVVFTTALHSGLLGALLTFASTPLYPVYRFGVTPWGLTLLTDQQLAGVIMWVPVGFFYLGAMLLLVAHWLQAIEQPQTHLLPVDEAQ